MWPQHPVPLLAEPARTRPKYRKLSESSQEGKMLPTAGSATTVHLAESPAECVLRRSFRFNETRGLASASLPTPAEEAGVARHLLARLDARGDGRRRLHAALRLSCDDEDRGRPGGWTVAARLWKTAAISDDEDAPRERCRRQRGHRQRRA